MWGLLVVCLLALATVLIGVIRPVRAWSMFYFMKKESDSFSPQGLNWRSGNEQLIVLLPCLNEQSIVNSTLNYMCAMPGVKEGKVLLVPITGESEEEIKKNRLSEVRELSSKLWHEKSCKHFTKWNDGLFPQAYKEQIENIVIQEVVEDQLEKKLTKLYLALPSTRKLINNWIENNPDFSEAIFFIHDPNKTGSKATKLNYAIEQLHIHYAEKMMSPLTYLGVYDFDSKPDSNTFAWLAAKIRDNNSRGINLPTVFQQPALTLGRELDNLNPLSSSFIASVWHLERSLGFEAFSHSNLPETKVGNGVLRNCVGAGLFIRCVDLKEIGPFPNNSDDIAFGYRLDLMKKRRELIPLPNYMQPVPSMGNLVKQFKRILIGIFSVGQEIEYLQEKEPHHVILQKNKIVCKTYWNVLIPSVQLLLLASTVFLTGFLFSIKAALLIFFMLYLSYMGIYANLTGLAIRIRHHSTQRLELKLRSRLLSSIVGALQYSIFRTYMILYFLIYVMPSSGKQEKLLSEKTDR